MDLISIMKKIKAEAIKNHHKVIRTDIPPWPWMIAWKIKGVELIAHKKKFHVIAFGKLNVSLSVNNKVVFLAGTEDDLRKVVDILSLSDKEPTG